MTLARTPDWPERLAAYLTEMRPRRYVLGRHDCASFAAGAVRAITGADVLPLRWETPAEAVAVLRRLGGLQAAVRAVLPQLATPALAQRGDVLLIRAPVADGRALRQWLAVADGQRWWSPSATGLECGSVHWATAAWGVGHG